MADKYKRKHCKNLAKGRRQKHFRSSQNPMEKLKRFQMKRVSSDRWSIAAFDDADDVLDETSVIDRQRVKDNREFASLGYEKDKFKKDLETIKLDQNMMNQSGSQLFFLDGKDSQSKLSS